MANRKRWVLYNSTARWFGSAACRRVAIINHLDGQRYSEVKPYLDKLPAGYFWMEYHEPKNTRMKKSLGDVKVLSVFEEGEREDREYLTFTTLDDDYVNDDQEVD